MLLVLVFLLGVSIAVAVGVSVLGSIGVGMFAFVHMVFPSAPRFLTITESSLLTLLTALVLFYEIKEWWFHSETSIIVSQSNPSTDR